MASNKADILLRFSGSPDDVLSDYIEHIANGGLTRYRRIIQWGNKDGQPLYAHVIDLVFTFARLADVLGLDLVEQRVMMLALSAHDINKVPGENRPSRFPDQASPTYIGAELERLGAESFFPEWRNYLEDICALIRSHGGHFHHAGNLLVVKQSQNEKFALGGDRVRELTKLMKALDVLDLSHTLNEQQHKQSFISQLNEFSDTQYKFVSHTVAEQRGILSNVIHNRIAEFMLRQKHVQPLLYYPDGVVYLMEQGVSIQIEDKELQQIAESIASFLEEQINGKWRTFIKGSPTGIKVDQKCLDIGIPFNQIWQEVDGIIQNKMYKTRDDMETNARRRTTERVSNSQSRDAEVVRAYLSREQLLPTTKTQLRLGELIRTYYNFLSKFMKKQVRDPWQRLYEMLEIPETNRTIYDFFETNQDRAYVVSGDLTIAYEDLFQKIVTDGSQLLGDKATESVWTPIFAEYVRQQVQFSFQSPPASDAYSYLQRYVQSNHQQSAFGSTSLESDLWRAGDVAKSIKVQQFSNRLLAGPGDPVKNVDPITKSQFLLEKLTYTPGFDATTYYMHIYPHAFYSDAYLRMWRDTVDEIASTHLADEKLNALFLKTDETLRQIFAGSDQIELRASPANSNGLPMPGAPELIGNLLIWPLNAPGGNDTERFWYAFTCAIAMHHFAGGRVILTRSSVPILSSEEAAHFELFTDEIPLSLNALLRNNGYNYEALPALESQLGALYNIQSGVRSDGDELLPLMRSLNDGALGIYFAAERFLLKRVKNDKKVNNPEWKLIQSAQSIANDLRLVTKEQGGDKVNETIQKLAQLAWDGNLKGQTLAKNSLMMPLDHCFEKVQSMQPPIDKETARAVTVSDIYSYLERIRDEGMVGNETQRKIKLFVDAFFDDLWGNHYANNRQRLLSDEKLIRSAFLFHIREILAQRAAEKANATKS